MEKILSFTKKNRILLSRVLIGCVVLLMVFSRPVWQPGIAAHIAIELPAFVLVLFAAFGRLWALSYISGHKTRDLITEGPYSIMRNPLYFFSLSGALGVCLLSRSLLVSGSILLAFAVYYPLVIRAEEKHLAQVHGESFRQYCSVVPLFTPKLSLFHEPKDYPVNARLFRRAFFSVMWFPLAFILIHFLGHLQEIGIVPVLLSIP
jgi:protein-S-isoprenylcysteine O-methyltransferase Ste14